MKSVTGILFGLLYFALGSAYQSAKAAEQWNSLSQSAAKGASRLREVPNLDLKASTQQYTTSDASVVVYRYGFQGDLQQYDNSSSSKTKPKPKPKPSPSPSPEPDICMCTPGVGDKFLRLPQSLDQGILKE